MKAKKPKSKAESVGEEITLRLDGELITPEDFKKAVQAFVELLLTVTEETSRGGKRPTWNMSVREGSTVLVASAVPDVETRRAARETIKRVRSGVSSMEKRGRIVMPDFTQKALYAVRELASLPAKVNRVGISTVMLGNGEGKTLALTSKTADFLKKNLGAQKSAYGSIEGKLSTISVRNTFQFVVYDALFDRGINCFMPEGKFKDAHSAFGKSSQRVRIDSIRPR